MQIQYAKLDLKLEEVFPAGVLRQLAEDGAGAHGGTGGQEGGDKDGAEDEDFLGGVFHK
jgi:hypothetical protein